jgi:predicted aspartyl protease
MKISSAIALALLFAAACALPARNAAAGTLWDDALACIAEAKNSDDYRAIQYKLPPTDGSAPSADLLANRNVPTDEETQHLMGFHDRLGKCRKLVLQASAPHPAMVAAYNQLYADIDDNFARLVRREMTWGQYAQAGARSLAAFRTHSVEAERTLIPLTRSGGVYRIFAVVNGSYRGEFVLDSGASDVSLSQSFLRVLVDSGTVTRADLGPIQHYRLADGRTVPSQTFHLRSIQVGDKIASNVLGSVAQGEDADMLLGQSFLRHFKSWSIDNTRHALVLE